MSIETDIITWLKSLKGWQCELAYRILSNGQISDKDYLEIVQMLKGNESFEEKQFPQIGATSQLDTSEVLRLTSIEAIKDIEMLSPKKPIVFGSKNIVVIYGDNGSGKSGITRILKRICGKSGAKALKGNIFKDNTNVGECSVKYVKGGHCCDVNWKADNAPIEDLICVDIYDTDTGISYINDAKSVTYTPKVVSLFDSLSRSYLHISQMLASEKDSFISALPAIPEKYSGTKIYSWYKNLKPQINLSLEDAVKWDDSKTATLHDLETRLRLKDATIAAKEKQANKAQTQQILVNLENAVQKISPKSYQALKEKKQNAETARRIANEASTVLTQDAELDGIGTPTWKALWETARQYSTDIAYPSFVFPFTGDNAKCVLCQQPLDDKAKHRLQSFNSFVQDSVELSAQKAEKEYKDAINELPKPIDEELLRTQCLAAGLDEHWYEQLKTVWGYIINVVTEIHQFPENIHTINQYAEYPIGALNKHIEELDKIIQQYLDDANGFNRTEAEQRRLEFEANKWCSEQYEAIKTEIDRLKTINQFEKWIAETNTQGVSRKASQISENAITEDYVKRFNDELKRLGATKIRAELVKQNISRGIPYHCIKIKGALQSTSPAEIFSEGEFRIISLAAFLADVTGGNNANPFIFDDPISSLDQHFEEATVDRLIELSKERQVIVFTHRLSLLGLIYDKYKRENDGDKIDLIGIRKEVWGTGEPSEIPFYGNPLTKFNKMKNEQLSEAKRKYEAEGYDAYYPLAKALCSDFRNMIEHTIESVLLAEVVVRYRRSVTTDGRIKSLAKISINDCVLMDSFMTKYSRYEHSQSYDTKVDMPEPTEIETDIQSMIDWLQTFKKRTIPET